MISSAKRAELWRKHRRKVRWCGGIIAAYTILGFLILPPLVKWQAARRLSTLLDRPVSIQKLRLNPYTFSITIRGFLIRDKDGESFVSWDEVYVNFQPTSVFARAWRLSEVRTSRPYVRVQVNKDATLNFSDLIQKFGQESGKPPSAPSKPPALRIDLLDIDGARASLADLTTRNPFRRIVGPLHITLHDFQTDPDNRNPYAFSGTTDSGERFSWSGHFFLEPIRSEGELSLENLVLSKYAPLYQDLVKFDIEDGVVDVRASYRLVKGANTNYVAITNTSVSLRTMKVKDAATGQPVAELPEFKMAGASVDVWGRKAEIASLKVNGGRLNVRRDRDAAINVIQLAQPAPTATNVSGGVMLLLQSVTNVFARLLQSTNQWQAAIREIDVRDCAVRLQDEVNSRPVNLVVDEINVAVRNVSNTPGTNLAARISARWNTNGTVRTDLSASLVPPVAEATIKVEKLELKPLDPYLEPFVDVLILRSRLGVDAILHMETEGTNRLPSVKLRGDIALEDMGAAEARTGMDMLDWKALRFSGIEASLDPPTFSARELALEDMKAHVIVETNGTINLLAAARLNATNAVPPADGKSASRPKGQELLKAAGRTNTAPMQLPVDVSLSAVVFSNALVHFNDHTVSPPVDVSLRNVNGALRGVSSRGEARTDLDIQGQVENAGSVNIKGGLYPMSVGRDTQVEVAVNGMDLNPTGPYVGKFLGYRLSKGRLGVDLKYTIRDGKVTGANIIKLDQFTLGEKVNSPDALSLPIKLGLAILKDRNGLIELDVPVEGRLEDPEFRLGKVVTHAIVNIITKLVTSPFAALGAAFGGGGEELSYQEFPPGSAELDPGGIGKLDKVINGLYERPGLQLEIEGAVDVAKDGAALRRQKLEGELRLSKWQGLGKAARAETSAEKISITPEEFNAFIERRYYSEFAPSAVAARVAAAAGGPYPAPAPGNPPGTPKPKGAPVDAPNKGAVALRSDTAERAPKAEAQTMMDQVIALVTLTDADYVQLASQRAKRVREYLLQSGKISQERILMSEPVEVTKGSKGSKVLLRLQ